MTMWCAFDIDCMMDHPLIDESLAASSLRDISLSAPLAYLAFIITG